jgi:cellulose synthase/poly-beta-1,6-N-acetylglucosamine synthase-like glycosyltransferase
VRCISTAVDTPVYDFSVYYASSWSPRLIRPGGFLILFWRQYLPISYVRVLKYVKGAIGETDVPDALPEFIIQRRRWLNGSFFAATYAIAHVGQIMRSGHSFPRKVMLMAETVYNTINLVFSWFSIVSKFIEHPTGES